MLIDFFLTQTGVALRVKCRQDNTGAKPGQGLTGLTGASTGLRIAAAADNESVTTAYTSGTSTIDTIATLGTFAAPTATHCRFKEYDATSHPGVYEVQFENSRFAVGSCKSLLCSITGVSGLADCDFVIPLRAVNPYSSTLGLSLAKGVNLTGLNDIAATAIVNGGAINTNSGAVSSVTTVATTTNLTNAPGSGDFTSTMKNSLNAATPASVQNVSAQSGDSFALLGAPAGASVSADIAAVKGETDTILTDVNTGGGAIYARIGAPAGASIAADIQTRSTYGGGPVASVTSPVTVGTNSDKTGYSLGSDGLDAVLTAEPDTTTDGPVSTWNFRKLLRWSVGSMMTGMRTLSSGTGTLIVQKLAGGNMSSQTIADDGAGNETLGAPT